VSFWTNATVLITGGSGSFGHAFARLLLESEPRMKALRIYSRDEYKQSLMRERFPDDQRIRFLLGDVRDRDRLYRAFDGVAFNSLIWDVTARREPASHEYSAE
jgi:UDP-N-acetylglucosamine 4,6-dehydratase